MLEHQIKVQPTAAEDLMKVKVSIEKELNNKGSENLARRTVSTPVN